MNLQEVKVVQDEEGNWYVIPDHMFLSFNLDLLYTVYDTFYEKWGKYRGDLNIIQLYAEL